MSQIIIVTGPSGAGKSTTCIALAKKSKGMWAYVGQDHIRTFVKSGYRHADVTWTDETKKQWEVSVAITCDSVKRYHEFGINCVVDCFAPPEEFKKYKKQLGNLPYKVVVLLPDVDQAALRNNKRKGRAKMKESKIRDNHEWFKEWQPADATVIDTSRLSLDETVKRIQKFIEV